MSQQEISFFKKRSIALISLFALLMGFLHISNILAAYSASNVIGQTTTGSPAYNDGAPNDSIESFGTFSITNPGGTIYDGTNERIFVADTSGNRILAFNTDSSGVPLDYYADFVIGQQNFSTSSSGNSDHQLSGPTDLEIDPEAGFLFVSDSLNNRVLVFDINSLDTGMSASYVLGQSAFGVGTSGVDADRLSNPTGLGFDNLNSRIFVADTNNNRVVAFSTNAGTIANGDSSVILLGQPNYTSNTAGTDEFTMSSPTDVAVGSGFIMVSELLNNRVLVFDIGSGDSDMALYVLGQPDFVSANFNCAYGANEFCGPGSVAYNSGAQELLVSDSYGNRVLSFDLNNISTYMSANGVIGHSDTAGSPGNTTFSGNTGYVSVPDPSYASTYKIYISDPLGYRVTMFDQGGNNPEISDVLGQVTSGTHDLSALTLYTPFNNQVSTTGFDLSNTQYSDNAVDLVNHRLFVSDTGNNRVLVYNLNSSNVAVDRTADYVLGQSGFSTNGADAISGQAGLENPTGLSYYENGGTQLLFVSDTANNRVMIFDVASITNGENAAHVIGQVDFSSNSTGNNPDQLRTPYGISTSTDGFLYVADYDNYRVQFFDISAITDGEAATGGVGGVMGTSHTEMGKVVDVEAFMDPSSLPLLAIADPDNKRVLIYQNVDRNSNGTPANNVLGVNDFNDPGSGLATASSLTPKGLAYSSGSEILYVSDSVNNRVLGFDLTQIVDGEDAVTVFGQDDFTSSAVGTSQSTLSSPFGLSMDVTNNRLWTIDGGNNRLITYDIVGITTADFASYNHQQIVVSGQGSQRTITGITGSFIPGFNGEFPFVSGTNSFAYLFGDTTVFNRFFTFTVDQVKDTLNGIDFFSNKNIVVSGTTAKETASFDPQPDGYLPFADFSSSMLDDIGDFAVDSINHRIFFTDLECSQVLGADINIDNTFTDFNSITKQFGDSDLDCTVDTASAQNMDAPSAVAYDTTDQLLFVADTMNNRVLVYNANGSSVLNAGDSADYVLGQPDFSTTTAATTRAGMQYPGGLTVDESRRKLFVADTGNNRVLVFDITTLVNGENAQNVIGQSSFTTREFNYSATNKMTSPTNLEFDQTTKELFVLNYGPLAYGARVQKFDTSSFTDGPSSTDQFVPIPGMSVLVNSLNSMSYDPDTKRVFVGIKSIGPDMVFILNEDLEFPLIADSDFDVPSGAGWIGTSYGNFGTMTSHGDDSDTSHFMQPYISFEPTTRTLYLFDFGSSRTLVFKFVHITNASLVSGQTGSAYSDTIDTENSQGVLTYSVASGSLPTGLSLNSSSGVISGTPTVAGTYSFSIDALDKVNNLYPNFQDRQSYSVVITSSTPLPQCNDTIDNDGDGDIDYPSDSGCSSASDDSETSSSSGSAPICNDRLDNDGDGLVDYPSDPGCISPADSSEVDTILAQCEDGVDNDSDGRIDYPNDLGCTSLTDNDESTSVFQCNDSVDNDSDGLVDYPNDPGCTSTTDNDESGNSVPPVSYVCNDGIDNDGDGLVDYPNDPGCSYPTDGNEYNAPVVTPPDDPILPPPTPVDGGPVVPVGGGEVTPVEPPETPVDDTPVLPPEDGGPRVLSEGNECFREITTVTPFGEVVIIQVRGTFCEVRNIVEETGGFISEVFGSSGNALTKIIAIVGLVMGAVFTVVPYLFLTPFSFSEVALLPYRLWSLVMSAFGIKKRARPWGTVYDATTKQPLDPAVVELLDLEGRPVATSTTDIDGRYGFLVGPGKYRLLPKKTHYAFPSLKMIGKTRDELYLDLYFGYVFEITKEGEVITKNIPMDPEKFDWNEFAKNQQKRMRFYSKRDFILNKISDYLFSIGFTVSIIALISAPSIYNIFIFLLYIIMLILREIGIKHTSFGNVKDAQGNPLSFAILRIFLRDGTEISHKVTNATGRFYCLLQNGTYIVTIERKNPDESYTKVYEQTHEIKKGVLKGTIVVK